MDRLPSLIDASEYTTVLRSSFLTCSNERWPPGWMFWSYATFSAGSAAAPQESWVFFRALSSENQVLYIMTFSHSWVYVSSKRSKLSWRTYDFPQSHITAHTFLLMLLCSTHRAHFLVSTTLVRFLTSEALVTLPSAWSHKSKHLSSYDKLKSHPAKSTSTAVLPPWAAIISTIRRILWYPLSIACRQNGFRLP